jgi:TPR repeat protein
MHSVNGSVYEGEWRGSERSGYGKLTTEAGVIYEGTWQDGHRKGFGVALRPDGSSYRGDWADDQRHGQGRETHPDGSFHEGAWQADQPVGPGTRRDRTGIELTGSWNGDQLTNGTMRLPSGAEYAGRLLISRNTAVDPGLLTWLEQRADEDDPWAHFFLGTAYADFSQPAPDLFKATGHFREAAQAGIPDGQFRLALLIVDKSPHRAIAWLEQAAQANQAQANTLLGEYYLTGRWVPEDVPAAIRYLRAGSDAGDMTARNNLAWVLATTEQPELRDGEASLALIRPLALLHGGWQHFDTLAAAYAATGNYSEAVRAEERAVAEASASLGSNSPEVAAMRERLDHYQARDPLRKK